MVLPCRFRKRVGVSVRSERGFVRGAQRRAYLRDEVLVLGGLEVLAVVHLVEVEQGPVGLVHLLAAREGIVALLAGDLPGEQTAGDRPAEGNAQKGSVGDRQRVRVWLGLATRAHMTVSSWLFSNCTS